MKLNYQVQGLYTDRYELEMARAYWQEGRQRETAGFDYSFRKAPFGGAMVVFAGLETLLQAVRAFRFPPETLDYLRTCGFPEAFLKYLSTFTFRGRISSVREGDIVFPLEPVLRVEGSLIETQLVETLVLNVLNFQSLIATKAARCRRMAGDRPISEFGLRRAQGLGGIWASRAAAIGGCASTSYMEAGRLFGIPVAGTMAHSFVQSYGSELEAFRAFARVHGSNSVLLLDTYDTLESGLPNAITVAKEMTDRGESLRGVRLDSGDLAYLSREIRNKLDAAGLANVRIVASNKIDEWIIRSLNEQAAPIDLFGIGTNLVIGHPDAVLDGVYKLNNYNDIPSMKFSEARIKETLPGTKSLTRFCDDQGQFKADAIHSVDEETPTRMIHPLEPEKQMGLSGLKPEILMKKVFEEETVLEPAASLSEIAAYAQRRLNQLPGEHLRLENPHTYRVGISPGLDHLRDRIKNKFKQRK